MARHIIKTTQSELQTDLYAGIVENPYVALIGNIIDYDSTNINYENQYFSIVALSDGDIQYNHKSGQNPMYYSIDGGEWIELSASSAITVSKSQVVRWKSTRGNQAYNQETFATGTAKIAVFGNLMSLVAGDNFTNYIPTINPTGSTGDLYRSFRYFFRGNTNLISAKNLIIKYTDNTAYREFFKGCTNLIIAPALPSTTLAKYCYQNMFQNCTSLTTAPSLPSTTLVSSCYQNMFMNCTSLTTAPLLSATTLADYCYSSMFNSCSSLTTAPELPATTLANGCYEAMFYGCTSLNHIKCIATDISAIGCTTNWVNNVSSTGTFVKNPNMNNWPTGFNGIPEGWVIIDAE